MKYCKACWENEDVLFTYGDDMGYCPYCNDSLSDPIMCECGNELGVDHVCCGLCGLTVEQIEEEQVIARHLDHEENVRGKE